MGSVSKIKGCVWAHKNKPPPNDGHTFVYAAREQNIPWFTLKRWSASDQPVLMAAAAFHPNSPQYQTVELLKRRLAHDEAQWFVQREDLTLPTLDALMRSDLYVDCYRLANHKNMIPSVLDSWGAGESPNMSRWERIIACAASQHLSEKTAQDIYDIAYSEPGSSAFDLEASITLHNLAGNPVTPEHILTELALHSDAYVRDALSKNPNVGQRIRLLANLVS